MLVLAEGLFRLDVALRGDTLATFVRNFTVDQLRMRSGVYGVDGANLVVAEAASYEPVRMSIAFSIGAVDVDVTVGTLRLAQRGTVRVSAQALVRETTSS
jgi:hypothetical protein